MKRNTILASGRHHKSETMNWKEIGLHLQHSKKSEVVKEMIENYGGI